MVYKATNLIAAAFDEKGIKYKIEETESLSFVKVGFTGDNLSVVSNLISTDNDNDVKIMTTNFAKFPEGKIEKGYEVVNQLNNKYRFAKFTIDSSGNVAAQYDLPVSTPDADVAALCVELVLRFAKIVDGAYPDVMKAIWS